MTLKDQLEQEIGKRQLYLSHASRDLDELSPEIPSRLESTSEIPTRLRSASYRPDVDALLLDHQTEKIVDDLIEPQLIGRDASPIRAAFARSGSPFRGHRPLPHNPVPRRSATHN